MTQPTNFNVHSRDGGDRVAAAPGRFERFLCVSVDVEGYGTTTAGRQSEIQRELVDLLDQAARGADLHRRQWIKQAKGDGELALIPSGGSDGSIVDSFVQKLATLLFERNINQPRERRLRLRLALDQGLVDPNTANGFAGQAVVAVSRLVDSSPVREALAAAEAANLAVILSSRVYSDLVLGGHTSLSPEFFRQVTARVKTFDEQAWLWVPGADPHRLSIASTSRGQKSDNTVPGKGDAKSTTANPSEVNEPSTHRRFWIKLAVVASAALVLVSVLVASTHPFDGSGNDSPSNSSPGALPPTETHLTITSGDDLDLGAHLAGSRVPYADLVLHVRYAIADQLELLPRGNARMARSTPAPDRKTCLMTLASHQDGYLIIDTGKQVPGAGDLAVGGWICVDTGHGPIAAIKIVGATDTLPGQLDLALVVWPD